MSANASAVIEWKDENYWDLLADCHRLTGCKPLHAAIGHPFWNEGIDPHPAVRVGMPEDADNSTIDAHRSALRVSSFSQCGIVQRVYVLDVYALAACIRSAEAHCGLAVPADWRAVLGMMNALANDGKECRVILWFDEE